MFTDNYCRNRTTMTSKQKKRNSFHFRYLQSTFSFFTIDLLPGDGLFKVWQKVDREILFAEM